MGKYRDSIAELEAQNIQYQPVCFSTYGRVHPEAETLIANVATQAARRRGLSDHRGLLRRAMAKAEVAIQRRAAKMILACRPRPSAREEALLYCADEAEAPDDDEGEERAARTGQNLVHNDAA